MNTTDIAPAEKLAKAIENTAARRADIDKISGKISSTKALIAELESKRQAHALDAALDQPSAVKALSACHDDQASAEKLLRDLEYAHEMARPKLALAMAEEGAARRQVNLEIAKGLVQKRILAAEKFDAAAAAMAEALREFDEHWDAIAVINEAHSGGQSVLDARRGMNRIKAALPVQIQRAFDLRTESQSSLARSEALTWQGTF
jgi:3-dehydroquinate dehydratase